MLSQTRVRRARDRQLRDCGVFLFSSAAGVEKLSYDKEIKNTLYDVMSDDRFAKKKNVEVIIVKSS